MTWPEENLKHAEAMWFEGAYASVIAERLGVTRNAVIGMAYRRKWPRGEVSAEVKATAARVRARAAALSRARKLAHCPETKEEVDMSDLLAEAPGSGAGSYTLLALPKNGCKWPLSGERALTLFCGKPQARNDVPYCPEHHRLSCVPTRGQVARPYKELAIR